MSPFLNRRCRYKWQWHNHYQHYHSRHNSTMSTGNTAMIRPYPSFTSTRPLNLCSFALWAITHMSYSCQPRHMCILVVNISSNLLCACVYSTSSPGVRSVFVHHWHVSQSGLSKYPFVTDSISWLGCFNSIHTFVYRTHTFVNGSSSVPLVDFWCCWHHSSLSQLWPVCTYLCAHPCVRGAQLFMHKVARFHYVSRSSRELWKSSHDRLSDSSGSIQSVKCLSITCSDLSTYPDTYAPAKTHAFKRNTMLVIFVNDSHSLN